MSRNKIYNMICPECGKPFHRSPSQISPYKLNFCSHYCSTKHYGMNHLNSPGQLKERSERWSGKNNPKWNNGICRTKKGKILIYKPDHPRAYKNGFVPEAYLLAEQALKRPLQPNEFVHLDYKNDQSVFLTIYTGSWFDNPTIIKTLSFPIIYLKQSVNSLPKTLNIPKHYPDLKLEPPKTTINIPSGQKLPGKHNRKIPASIKLPVSAKPTSPDVSVKSTINKEINSNTIINNKENKQTNNNSLNSKQLNNNSLNSKQTKQPKCGVIGFNPQSIKPHTEPLDFIEPDINSIQNSVVPSHKRKRSSIDTWNSGPDYSAPDSFSSEIPNDWNATPIDTSDDWN